MLEGKLISIVWLGLALHIGTTTEHSTQEQINRQQITKTALRNLIELSKPLRGRCAGTSGWI
jgi:cytochrome c556